MGKSSQFTAAVKHINDVGTLVYGLSLLTFDRVQSQGATKVRGIALTFPVPTYVRTVVSFGFDRYLMLG